MKQMRPVTAPWWFDTEILAPLIKIPESLFATLANCGDATIRAVPRRESLQKLIC
jgi:hypothetical protein